MSRARYIRRPATFDSDGNEIADSQLGGLGDAPGAQGWWGSGPNPATETIKRPTPQQQEEIAAAGPGNVATEIYESTRDEITGAFSNVSESVNSFVSELGATVTAGAKWIALGVVVYAIVSELSRNK